MSLQESLQKLQEFDISEIDVNDIDFNNIGSWPLAGRLVIWIIVFVAALFGFYKMNLADLHKALEREEAKEITLREEFEKKVNEAANLEAYRTQMVEMEESFQALLKQLPQDTEVPGLLDDISNKGLDSGLTFNTIDLQPERSEEYYVELPIEINVAGGYHDFGSFVSGIAGLPRIVTLHDFSLSGSVSKGGRSKGSVTDTKGALGMKILAKTYRYRAKEE